MEDEMNEPKEITESIRMLHETSGVVYDYFKDVEFSVRKVRNDARILSEKNMKLQQENSEIEKLNEGKNKEADSIISMAEEEANKIISIAREKLAEALKRE